MGTVEGGGEFKEGAEVTLTATPKTNCAFSYWEDSKGKKYTQNPLTFNASADETYTAHFGKAKYILSVEYNEEYGDISGAGAYEYLSKAILTATPKAGFHFDGWYSSEGGTTLLSNENPREFPVLNNLTVFARFGRDLETVNITTEHGTATAKGDINSEFNGKFYYGKAITLTATPDDDYTFLCWEKDGITFSTDATTTYTVDLTNDIEAVFKQVEHRDENVTVNGITYHLTDTKAEVTAVSDSLAMVNILPEVDGLPVSSVKESAFGANESVVTVIIPASLRSGMFRSTFKGCPNLKQFIVDPQSTYFKDIDGVLFSADGTKLVLYPPAYGDTYAVPDGTETIGDKAFAYTNIKDVTFPDSVKLFEYDAFLECDSLKEVVLNDGVETLRYNAFAKCDELESVYVPASCKFIDNAVFEADPKLAKITIDMTAEDSMIYAMPETISNGTDPETFAAAFAGTIYGPAGGEAEEYADQMGYTFVSVSVLSGDVNGDGIVDKLDDVTLSRYVAGWSDVTIDDTAADINKDGSVTLIDSVILSRHIAGWTEYDSYFTA
ncbi:MAG: leucine-rich repeat protein [Ruminococcus sp.]|nr:leucine-rich repeat protein [Ruminococcus sp.]